MVILAKQLKN